MLVKQRLNPQEVWCWTGSWFTVTSYDSGKTWGLRPSQADHNFVAFYTPVSVGVDQLRELVDALTELCRKDGV